MKNLLPFIIFLAGMQLYAQGRQFINHNTASLSVKAAARTQGSNDNLPYRFTRYIYDTSRQSYILKVRELYTYDQDGNTTQLVTQVNKNDSAVDSLRYLFTYSEDGLAVTQITQTMDPLNHGWINKEKDTFASDIHGNEIYNGSYKWINDSWQPAFGSKMEYIYDKDGHIINYTLYTQANAGSSWTLNEKDSCVVDGNGKVKRQLVYTAGTKGNLQLFKDYFYLDLVDNNVHQPLYDSMEYIFSPTSAAKITDSFTYTANSWVVAHTQKRLTNGIWTKTEQEKISYNAHNDRIQYISWGRMFDGSFDTTVVLADSILYDDQGRKTVDFASVQNGPLVIRPFIERDKYTWDYRKDDLPSKSAQATLFTVYPNPSKDILHVVFNNPQSMQARVSLYDMQGRKVWSALSAEKTIDITVSDIPAGIYGLRVECANQLQCTKVIKY